MNLIDQYSKEIHRLCSTHRVKNLYAFGSITNEHFNSASDIDLIVDFEPIDVKEYADNYFSFKFALEDTLLRKIDLIEEKAIRNPFFRESVQNHKRLIYGH